MLAAHLERHGWQVRLSVLQDEVKLGPEATGVDWAKAVAYAQHPGATDSAHRYDGIWHDASGNIDLVAWRGLELLLVEAKGVTVRGGRVNREKAAVWECQPDLAPP